MHIIIENSLEEMIIANDNAYESCRKGVNLPINFATQIIGVIGITGEPSETIKYGRILQKMTEMLIRHQESYPFFQQESPRTDL